MGDVGQNHKITNQLLFNRNLFDFLTPTTLIKDEETIIDKYCRSDLSQKIYEEEKCKLLHLQEWPSIR